MTLPVAILAGGLATRLGPLTQRAPKALVMVAGEPFVHHQLRLLARNGIRRVVFCVGYLGSQIVASIGDGARFGIEVRYVFDGPHLLGTAGALRNALPELGDAFFVLYGDSYLECDYQAVAAAWRASRQPALMTVYCNHGAFDTSNVEFVDGVILAYSKASRTPRMRHIDYGLSVLTAAVLDELTPGTNVDLASVWEQLAKSGRLAAFEAKQRFFEVGSFAGITDLDNHLRTLGGFRP